MSAEHAREREREALAEAAEARAAMLDALHAGDETAARDAAFRAACAMADARKWRGVAEATK